MLVVKKIDGYMVEIDNTFTGTPLRIPTHWLDMDEEIREGDVIKIVKDEVNTLRREKELKGEINNKRG